MKLKLLALLLALFSATSAHAVMAGFPGRMGPVGAGTSAEQPLRAAAVQNRVNSGSENISGHTRMLTRWNYELGSGDFSQIVMNVSSLLYSNTPALMGNAYTIEKMSFEKGDGSASVPVTFNGSRSLTVSPGDNDVNSDPIYPSSFSLSSFARDSRWFVRSEISVPTTSGKIPYTTANTGSGLGNSVGWFTPASTTVVNGVDGFGAFTVSGTSLVARTAGFRPIVLGKFTSGDPKTIIGSGDSIMAGVGDSGLGANDNVNGAGFFQRAMHDPSSTANSIANINISVGGTGLQNYVATYGQLLKPYLKYGRVLVEHNGANEFGGGVSATVQGWHSTMYSDFKSMQPSGFAAGVIVRGPSSPRANSTDNWATSANQTYYNSDFGPSGVKAAFDTWAASLVGSVVDYSWNSDVIADSVDRFKWKSDGTAYKYASDNVHPAPQGHADLAAQLRTALGLIQ